MLKVRETVRKHSLLSPGDRLVVAVSGGPDSVCLVSVLLALSRELDLTLHIAHLDHMFRGAESEGEAVFVADLAKRLGLPATTGKFDVPGYCRQRGLSAQAGAREVRYGFLGRVAEEIKADRIATGHTASDQAETFLLRLLRGAGITGLAGIPAKRDNIVRPLIEVTREEVLGFLASTGLSFVTDPSNSKPIYARNRVRNELLPLLRQYNPGIVETLAFEAALLRDEDAAMETCLSAMTRGVIEGSGDGMVVNRKAFNALPQAFRRRLLKKAVDAAGTASPGLSRIQVDQAVGFMETAQTGRAMELLHGFTLVREYERFLLRKRSESLSLSADLAVPGKTTVPAFGLEIENTVSGPESREGVGTGLPEDSGIHNYLWQARFDYDKMGAQILVRNRLAGDWFCPSGMAGKHKKLQDFFVDARIPRERRDLVPLLCAGGSVVWVMGLRTDERFLPGPDTRRILTVTVRRE